MRLIFALSLLLLTAPAFAGPELNKCNQSSDESNKACDGATTGAKNAESAMVAAGSAMSGQKINQDSGIDSTAIGAQNENLGKAISACQAALAKCQQECDTQLQIAQSKAAVKPPTPISIQAQQDVAQIPGAKQSKCEGPLQQKIAKLNADKAPLNGQQKEADKTGQASMPQMPSPGGGGSGDQSSPTTPSTPNTPDQTCSATGSGTNCSAATTPTFNSASDGQAGFSNPKAADGTSNSAPASTDPGSTDAVRTGVSPGAATTGFGGGGSGGGGGSLGGSTAANAAALAGGAGGNGNSREGATSPGIGSLSTEGGGGGGGGYSGNSGDSSSNNSEFTVATTNFGRGKEKPLLPASPMAGSPYTDRSQPNGPSIFYIQSAAIGSYCSKKGVKRNCAN